MITLYQWPSHGSLPNSGMFCMKLEAYLRLMKVEHKVIPTIAISKSPKKTMPYADLHGQLFSDSQLIINNIEAENSIAIDAHLSALEKSQATAYRLLIENHLVNILIYFRWHYQPGWDQFSRMIFANAPSLVRWLVGGKMRKETIKSLYKNGISRHTQDEILDFADTDLSALSVFLGNKPFMFGEKISLVDLSLFAIIGNIVFGNIDMPLIAVVKKYPNLIEHCQRLMKLVYNRELS